jgi:DNA-binding FadR family transcriptional regulator
MTTAARSPRARFEPIQQLRAHESVAEQIRRHIELRLVGPGEALPSERELAATFGVGRATIQHALRLLEADHLVETRRGRLGGTFVTRPAENARVQEQLLLRILRGQDEIGELLVYRAGVEPVVAGLAAGSRSRDDLAAMRRELGHMERARTEPEYMRADTEFHLAVARATGNRYLVRAVEEIRAQLNDALSLLPETDAWHSGLSEEHDAVVAAIEAGDEAAAGAAMARHVHASNQSIRAVLDVLGRRHGIETVTGGKEER